MCFLATIRFELCNHTTDFCRPCERWNCDVADGFQATINGLYCEACRMRFPCGTPNLVPRVELDRNRPRHSAEAEVRARNLLAHAETLIEDSSLIAQAEFVNATSGLAKPYALNEIRERKFPSKIKGCREYSIFLETIAAVQTMGMYERKGWQRQRLTRLILKAYIASLIASHEDKYFALAVPSLRERIAYKTLYTDSLSEDGRTCIVCAREYTDSKITNPNDDLTQPIGLNCKGIQHDDTHIICSSCMNKIAEDSYIAERNFRCPICRCKFPMVALYKNHIVDLPLQDEERTNWFHVLWRDSYPTRAAIRRVEKERLEAERRRLQGR